MIPYQVIARKRDGGELTAAEIDALITAYLRGALSEAQMSAFLMAAFLRGLSDRETVALTRAMTASGEVWDFSNVPGPKIDKHSTGGVGDKVSLVLAPWAAACGVVVPMMSGCGLGHTGGTLDKLATIPGFTTALDQRRARMILKKTGAVMLAATRNIAPADWRMYALRDATGTVESIPLITASILSKKLAEGAEGFVFDVKYGSGAFLPELSRARRLAESLVDTARRAGKKAVAVVTAMDQPTGQAAGNACEVAEAIACLRTRQPADLYGITRALGVEMLLLGGLCRSRAAATTRLEQAIEDRSAVAKLRELIAAQGGDPRVVDDPGRLPQPRYRAPIIAPRSGIIQRMDTRQIGWALVELGVGRKRPEDVVDLSAGMIIERKIGDRIAKGESIGAVMGGSRAKVCDLATEIAECLTVGLKKVMPLKLIQSRYDGRRWIAC